MTTTISHCLVIHSYFLVVDTQIFLACVNCQQLSQGHLG